MRRTVVLDEWHEDMEDDFLAFEKLFAAGGQLLPRERR
jgi:hypothetical protein